MIKVFLVEDESLIREGIRDSVAWEQLGMEFCGEAADGELALPMIRKIKPDVLITDIKMPFMDGLDLCGFVVNELPDTKIIIISGYDDFDYARKAIELHVDKYLLKPITKAEITKTLTGVKEQIEQEREQKDYLLKFNTELQEYEQFSRKKFFEGLFSGSASVNELYKNADELGMDLNAEAYNIVMFIPQVNNTGKSENILVMHERLLEQLDDGRYMLVRWNLLSFAIFIKSSADDIDKATSDCVGAITHICKNFPLSMGWYVSAGEAVNRLSAVAECFEKTNHVLSYRHIYPEVHILNDITLVEKNRVEDMDSLNDIDVSMVDPAVVKSFLQTGLKEEIEDFVTDYLAKLSGAVKSVMFRNYLILNTRYLSAIFVKGLGYEYENFLNELPAIGMEVSVEGTKEYMTQILTKAVGCRDEISNSQSKSLIHSAIEYIDEHFSDADISLITVADYVKISPNYFSAMFSQEVGQTFVEYLTGKRMDKARELLRVRGLRTGEVSDMVGYRDPRYFSFIFKKMTGSTPRDYRAGK